MASWMVPIALGLVTVGLIVPFHSIMLVTGPNRRLPILFSVLINPVAEEFIFRLLLLGYLSTMFEFTLAVILMSVVYSLYMGIVYGTPSMADGLVLGILLSFAMVEFGFPIVVAAHLIYRVTYLVW